MADEPKILFDPNPEVGSSTSDGAKIIFDPAFPEGGIDQPTEVTNRESDADIRKALTGKGAFDPHTTFEIQNGRLSLFDFQRSEDIKDKVTKFKLKFPKGELIPIPTSAGEVLVARSAPDQPYTRLGNVGNVTSAVANPQTALGIGAGIMTGGLGTLASMGVMGAVGAIGKGIDISIEKARGYDEDKGALDIALEMGTEGALNAAIEPISRGLTGARSYLGAKDLDNLTPLAEASKATGVKVLRGQIGHPLKQAMFSLVSRLSKSAKAGLLEQQQQLADKMAPLGELSQSMLDTMSDRSIARYTDMYVDDIIHQKFGSGAASRYAMGAIQRAALKKFKVLGKEANDRLYHAAERVALISDPVTGQTAAWNARPVQAWAEEATKPVTGLGKDLEKNGGNVQLSKNLNPELESIFSALKDLDPTIMLHNNQSGLKQLMTLRTRVGDLLEEDLPGTQNKLASELYDRLTQTIDNPVSAAPGFSQAWGDATEAYRQYATYMRTAQVKIALAENAAPEAIASKFLQPGDLEFKQALKKYLTNSGDKDLVDSWEAIRRGWLEEQYKDGKTLSSADEALMAFGNEERNFLFSQAEQRTLREASHQAKQIQNGPMAKMLQEYNTEGARLMKFAQEGNEAEIARYVEKAGGHNSEEAAALRGGVYQTIIENALTKNDDLGVEVLDPRAVFNQIQNLAKSNRLRPLFNDDDWRMFKNNWPTLTAVIGKSIDNGASLQAGEMASRLAESPIMMATNMPKLAHMYLKLNFQDIIGQYLAKPANLDKIIELAATQDARQRDRAIVDSAWMVLNRVSRAYSSKDELTPEQEGQREVEKIKEKPYLWDYIKNTFGGSPSPEPEASPVPQEAPAPTPAAPPPAPAPQQQGAAPPMPSPMQQGIGSKYAALFPNDSLGAMASMRG